MIVLATALRQHLLDQPSIASLVSDRIYPVQAPQTPSGAQIQPMIVYRLTGRKDDQITFGAPPLIRTKWEITCLAPGYDEAHQLAEAVITSLAGLKGDIHGARAEHAELDDAYDEDTWEFGFHAVTLIFELVWRS